MTDKINKPGETVLGCNDEQRLNETGILHM